MHVVYKLKYIIQLYNKIKRQLYNYIIGYFEFKELFTIFNTSVNFYR